MIDALRWLIAIFMWIVAGAFMVSDIFCFLALIHHCRREPGLALIYGVVILIFAVLGAGAAYVALSVGRGLA